MMLRRSRAAFVAASILSVPLALSPIVTTPAAAQWVVFDPSNYAQNVLTAAWVEGMDEEEIHAMARRAKQPPIPAQREGAGR